MSATDELRRMLDERRVEWYEAGGVTFFGTSEYDTRYAASEPECGIALDPLTPEQAIAATSEPLVTGETSDGYHTFNELYHHRAVLFGVIVHDHRDIAWKSKRHHDGTMYDGMFIVGIQTPLGHATYHYDIDPYWDMFDCVELDHAPEWDGHTPDDAVVRIAGLRELDSGRGTCHLVAESKSARDWPNNERCDHCGEYVAVVSPEVVRYCPSCGRRIVG